MKKLISVILLIAVLSLVSTAAYIYFSTKNAVDSMIESAQPFVNIKYQRFSNPMDGSISIHGVTVGNSYGSNIDVGSIELKMDSALDYINLEKKITSGEILPKLQLQINHLYADMDLIQKGQKSSEKNSFESISSYIAGLGCGDVKSVGVKQLSSLGYSGIDGSINLNFEYDNLSSTVTMEFDYLLHGMGAFLIKTSMPNIYSAEDFSNINNKLNSLAIEIQDLGYNKNLIEYCSSEAKVDSKVYIEQHLRELKNYLTKAKINISDELYAAYRSYFTESATLTLTSQPKNAVDLKYIALYETKDWPSILGLAILVNDSPVNDLAFEWNKNTVIRNLMTAKVNTEEKSINGKDSSPSPQIRRKQNLQNKSYFEIPVSELGKHINADVKLETKLGKAYTGYIKGVTHSQVIVVISLKGGKAEIPVGTNKISKAFIYK